MIYERNWSEFANPTERQRYIFCAYSITWACEVLSGQEGVPCDFLRDCLHLKSCFEVKLTKPCFDTEVVQSQFYIQTEYKALLADRETQHESAIRDSLAIVDLVTIESVDGRILALANGIQFLIEELFEPGVPYEEIERNPVIQHEIISQHRLLNIGASLTISPEDFADEVSKILGEAQTRAGLVMQTEFGGTDAEPTN